MSRSPEGGTPVRAWPADPGELAYPGYELRSTPSHDDHDADPGRESDPRRLLTHPSGLAGRIGQAAEGHCSGCRSRPLPVAACNHRAFCSQTSAISARISCDWRSPNTHAPCERAHIGCDVLAIIGSCSHSMRTRLADACRRIGQVRSGRIACPSGSLDGHRKSPDPVPLPLSISVSGTASEVSDDVRCLGDTVRVPNPGLLPVALMNLSNPCPFCSQQGLLEGCGRPRRE